MGMRVIYDIIFFWLPAALAVMSPGWAAVLVSRARSRMSRIVLLVVFALVILLAGLSLWALIATFFFDSWPTFMPYLFVAVVLVLLGICDTIQGRRWPDQFEETTMTRMTDVQPAASRSGCGESEA
jgi:fatty acid desaturase